MKPRKNQLKYAMMALLLCTSLLFFNSCQTSEDELVFNSEQLFTKESKIVSLFLSAVESSAGTTSFKSSNTEGCTEFVYPMTFFVYENDDDTPAALVITSDQELVAFLDALTSGQQFFITYPVTLVDVDGVETVITDYPDLEGILTMLVDACSGGDDDDDDDNGDDTDGDDTDGDDTNGDDGDDDSIKYEYCGKNNKKVVICHNGQSICISINAIWGHMAHHPGDYYGSCNN